MPQMNSRIDLRSTVNAGMSVELNDKNVVRDLKLVYGGVTKSAGLQATKVQEDAIGK